MYAAIIAKNIHKMESEKSCSKPSSTLTSICSRKLTSEEEEWLEKDMNVVSDFKQNKLEVEAKRNWDLFYKRNSTNFFKDRHWTMREFQELLGAGSESCKEKRIMLEVGCGVGNMIFPLLAEKDLSLDLFVYACDFSPRALQFIKDNPLYSEETCKAFQCDVTSDDLSEDIHHSSVDLVTMIFVLSAIHPEKMVKTLQNIFNVVKPGGYVLFRDYGLYDHAQLRFKPGHKLSDNFYVRQDGTRAYYFSLEILESIFRSAGFDVITNVYMLREIVNRKKNLQVPRIFVQGKFRKPCLKENN